MILKKISRMSLSLSCLVILKKYSGPHAIFSGTKKNFYKLIIVCLLRTKKNIEMVPKKLKLHFSL